MSLAALQLMSGDPCLGLGAATVDLLFAGDALFLREGWLKMDYLLVCCGCDLSHWRGGESEEHRL